jgi:hypothetical protein
VISATLRLRGRSTRCGAPQGRHCSGGTSPKKHTMGFCSAAARCIAPPSLVITASLAASAPISSGSEAVR